MAQVLEDRVPSDLAIRQPPGIHCGHPLINALPISRVTYTFGYVLTKIRHYDLMAALGQCPMAFAGRSLIFETIFGPGFGSGPDWSPP
jgi:hypothetical protein